MPITRQFLGWDRPLLRSAAEQLLVRLKQGSQVDMRGLLVVVPGRRAGRRLLEILVQDATTQRLALLPPEIITEGQLPEKLYTPKRPFADVLTQDLTWARALATAPLETREKIVPHPPAADDVPRWLELGRMIRRQHTELAADGLDFSHVAEKGCELPGFDIRETERWQALRAVQEAYLKKLDALGLWDVQTARLFAIRQREPRADREIFLLGTVDLNLAARQMLDQVAERVTAVIAAPAEFAADFDEHGCLRVERWLAREVPLDDAQLHRVEGPADQAEEVARRIAAFAGRYRADEITLGVPDEALVPQLQRQLEQCGLASRWVEGKHLSQTGPYRLLATLADYAEGRRFAPFASLVRHPDVQDWLREKLPPELCEQLLTAIDTYYGHYLPTHLSPEWLGAEEEHATIKAASEQIETLIAAGKKTLRDWSPVVQQVLVQLYDNRLLDRNRLADRATIACLQNIADSLDAGNAVPESLQPKLDYAQALRLILEPVAAESVPQAGTDEAVEILGWLELTLDDAPALVVTTFNEGFVPEATTADAFLPNRLRQHLGLLDNDRRYARDAYATQVLLASRRDLAFILARRDSEKNPLLPSRLVFAADEATVARRALALFQKLPPSGPRRSLLAGDGPPPAQSAFCVPLPQPSVPQSRFAVTQFRAYLQCPYRYYLGYVLRLAELNDNGEELDGGAFGSLAHRVLEKFGGQEPAVRESGQVEKLQACLESLLDEEATRAYGKQSRRGSVALQVEQVRMRLRKFAEWQAERNDSGWRIVHSEAERQDVETAFQADDGPATLRGRIDRIDWHEQRGKLQVLDYKTSDNGVDPAAAHRNKATKEWLDLQLPLYRHLVRELKLPQLDEMQKLEFGYINLPKDLNGVGHRLAPWDDSDLDSADAEARRIIQAVRAGKFWEPERKPPKYSEVYAAICQDRLQVRRLAAAEVV